MNPHRIIFTMVVCVYIFFERPVNRLMKLWHENKDDKVKTL